MQAMPVQLPMYSMMQNPMSLVNYQQPPAGAGAATPAMNAPNLGNMNRMHQQPMNPFTNQAGARH